MPCNAIAADSGARAITALATALGMETIAEGVADRDHLEALRAQGCTHVQDCFFSRPVNIDQVDPMIPGMRYVQPEHPAPEIASALPGLAWARPH